MSNKTDVDKFVKLTGASVEVARMFLEACSGNLEMAIGMHLDQPTSSQHMGDLENGLTSDSYQKM